MKPGLPAAANAWIGEASPSSVHHAGVLGCLQYSSLAWGTVFAAFILGLIAVLMTQSVWPVLIALPVAGAAAFVAIYQFRRTVRSCELYPEGMVWLDKGEWHAARWEEIKEVYREEIRDGMDYQSRIIICNLQGGR